MADIAGKQFRAEQLREELRVLSVKRTEDMTEASQALHEAKLDAEIAELERQVAVAQIQADTGGSVVDAMEVMAKAAEAEDKAKVEAAKLAFSSEVDKKDEAPKSEDTKETLVVVEPKVEPKNGLDLKGGNQ